MMAILRNSLMGFTLALLIVPLFIYAQSAEDIRNKINQQQSDIAEIEAEIRQYETQLTEIGREKQTLESAVRELDVSRKKVNASISLAQQQINATSVTINELIANIEAKRSRIARNQDALAATIRQMNEKETESFVEIILGNNNISSLWSDFDTLQQFQVVLRSEVESLAQQKAELEKTRAQKEIEQDRLVTQKTELSTQRRSLDLNRQAKNSLLAETENRESTYQDLLAEKRAAKEEFEAQLRSLESDLQYILDPSSIPPAGKGVFKWPLSNVRITQYFGNTEFAKSGAYDGNGHNGMDMGTPIGTPVKAVLAGNVRATGNTDLFRGCYSYGKWVLVEHANGLTTLYAHLSDINVRPGDAVNTGSVIAYSGNSGYSTGPHLHLTVYASDAVQVVRLGDVKSRTNCADAEIPVSAWEGYLNPLDFLE
jgi:murein DD-endopeptidase MepM/ murein hydrolase activator NlpD